MSLRKVGVQTDGGLKGCLRLFVLALVSKRQTQIILGRVKSRVDSEGFPVTCDGFGCAPERLVHDSQVAVHLGKTRPVFKCSLIALRSLGEIPGNVPSDSQEAPNAGLGRPSLQNSTVSSDRLGQVTRLMVTPRFGDFFRECSDRDVLIFGHPRFARPVMLKQWRIVVR